MTDLRTETGGKPPAHGLSFGAWLATEGGRKCPQCCRYARTAELGFIGGTIEYADGTRAHITMYGHLPGFGCNVAKEPQP